MGPVEVIIYYLKEEANMGFAEEFALSVPISIKAASIDFLFPIDVHDLKSKVCI